MTRHPNDRAWIPWNFWSDNVAVFVVETGNASRRRSADDEDTWCTVRLQDEKERERERERERKRAQKNGSVTGWLDRFYLVSGFARRGRAHNIRKSDRVRAWSANTSTAAVGGTHAEEPRNDSPRKRASITMRPWTNKSLGLGFLGVLLIVSGTTLYLSWPAIFHHILQKVSGKILFRV